MNLRSWLRVGSAASALFGVLWATGCAAPPPAEGKRAVTFKLLATDPLMRVAASSATKDAYGIDEWRFYRGRGSIFVTGYNTKKKKAVKGLATKIARNADGTISNLELDMNNGSKVAVLTSLASGGQAINTPVSLASQAFLRRAVLDFSRIGVAADLRLRNAGIDATAADVCGSALPNGFARLASCVASAGQNQQRINDCVIAAQLAEQTRLNCRGLASPLGRVTDPLPLGLEGEGLGSLCNGDSTCARDMLLLEQEETFGRGCGGDLDCLTGGFGFERLGPGSGAVQTRPGAVGSLFSGVPDSGVKTCASGNCGSDIIGNFRCNGGTCTDIPEGGVERIGNFTCKGDVCSDIQPGSGTSTGPEKIGNFTCDGDTCSDIPAGRSTGPEKIGNFTCDGDSCSDIPAGRGTVDQTEQTLVAREESGEVLRTDFQPPEGGNDFNLGGGSDLIETSWSPFGH